MASTQWRLIDVTSSRQEQRRSRTGKTQTSEASCEGQGQGFRYGDGQTSPCTFRVCGEILASGSVLGQDDGVKYMTDVEQQRGSGLLSVAHAVFFVYLIHVK